MDETEKPDSEITFNADGAWVMKISQGKIRFNREVFSALAEDEFANGVLRILEKAKIIQFDKSQWEHGRLKLD